MTFERHSSRSEVPSRRQHRYNLLFGFCYLHFTAASSLTTQGAPTKGDGYLMAEPDPAFHAATSTTEHWASLHRYDATYSSAARSTVALYR